MAAVTVLSDFGTQENKVCHCFHFFPIYLPRSDATWCSVGFWSEVARASVLLISHSIMSEFTIPGTAACQASLSITISQSLLKLTSIESLMPPNHLSAVVPFSSCLQSFPASGYFLMSLLLTSRGQNIGASASASVLPMNIQDWFILGLTDLISFQSEGLLRVFSNTTVQKHQFFSTQASLRFNSYIYTWLLEKP